MCHSSMICPTNPSTSFIGKTSIKAFTQEVPWNVLWLEDVATPIYESLPLEAQKALGTLQRVNTLPAFQAAFMASSEASCAGAGKVSILPERFHLIIVASWPKIAVKIDDFIRGFFERFEINQGFSHWWISYEASKLVPFEFRSLFSWIVADFFSPVFAGALVRAKLESQEHQKLVEVGDDKEASLEACSGDGVALKRPKEGLLSWEQTEINPEMFREMSQATTVSSGEHAGLGFNRGLSPGEIEKRRLMRTGSSFSLSVVDEVADIPSFSSCGTGRPGIKVIVENSFTEMPSPTKIKDVLAASFPTPSSQLFRKKVLILDDETVNGLLLLRLFSRFAYPVWVNTGVEALNALKQVPFCRYNPRSKLHEPGREMRFDMALIDFDMPGELIGPRVAALYREYEEELNRGAVARKRLPLVTYTSNYSSEAELAGSSLEHLFDGVLPKPTKFAQALSKMREIFPGEAIGEDIEASPAVGSSSSVSVPATPLPAIVPPS